MIGNMTFKDYYSILGIGRFASFEEIKAAYRAMSKKWHPDMNPNVDVKHRMQDINEAYAILKDCSKKTRYDREYDAYHAKNRNQYSYTETSQASSNTDAHSIHDEELKKDINDARKYAEHLVSEFLANLKTTSKNAAKGAWEESKGYVYFFIISTIIGLLIMTCSS